VIKRPCGCWLDSYRGESYTCGQHAFERINIETNIAGTPAKDDDMSTKNRLLTAYREGRDAVGRYAESENDEAWDLRVEAAGREANAAYALKQMAEDPVHMDLPIDPDVRINTDTKGHPHA